MVKLLGNAVRQVTAALEAKFEDRVDPIDAMYENRLSKSIRIAIEQTRHSYEVKYILLFLASLDRCGVQN